MTRPLVTRELSGLHPKANLPCLHCGTDHTTGAHGPTCGNGYTFTVAEIAGALVDVGKGGSYCKVSADIRLAAMRKRQPGRRKPMTPAKKLQPRKELPPRTPRNLLDKKAAAKKRPDGPLVRKNYGYGTAKPKEPVSRPSRSGNLAQGYVDVFAPVIFASFPVTTWPSIVIIDSLPIKRRRIAMSKSKGKVGRISAGERQGEIYAAADGTTTPGTPILAGLEGSKDSTSVERFLGRLETKIEPVWVVADIDEGIRVAVENKWPSATLYRCEEHLKMRCRLALAADGIDQWVPFDHPHAMPKDTKGVKISGQHIEHRLFHTLHSAMWTEKRWAAFRALVDGLVKPDNVRTRTWIVDNTPLVLSQIELRKQHKGFPRSTGAIEGTIRRIKHIVGNRAEYFRNGERLDKLVNLIRLDAIGLADLDTYASLIAQHLVARGGAGLDWRSGRDEFGTVSIDDRIELALNEHAPAAVARRKAQRSARIAKQTLVVNERLADQGLPPIGRVLHAEPLDPIYQIPRRGRTLVDYPELLAQYDPARNGFIPPEKRTAASQKDVEWVCSAHRTADGGGHDHVWPAPVERRTSGSRCPFCAGKQVCATSSLRHRRTDLTDEWYQPLNGLVTPDDVSPGMNNYAFWKCLKNAAHKPFRQRIQQRDAEHKRCPECVAEEQMAGRRATTNAFNQDQRERASRQSPTTVPPVLDAADLEEVPAADEPVMSVHEAAVALVRSEQTIRNWMRDGRLKDRRSVGSKSADRIPRSEVARVLRILTPPAGSDREAA